MSRNNDTGRVSRRKLLRGAAVTGVVGLTGAVPTAAAERADEKVTEVTGEDKRQVVGEALSDADVRSLQRQFVRNGWKPQVDDANVLYTADEESDAFYHTVVVPFATGADDEQVMIAWTDSEQFETQGRHYVHRSGRTWTLESYTVEGGSVTTATTETFDVDAVQQDGVSTQVWCGNINWACVLSLAGSYASTIAACGACYVDPTKLTCLSCIGGIMGSSGATLSCDWCND